MAPTIPRTGRGLHARSWQVRLASAVGLATFVVATAGVFLRLGGSGYRVTGAANQLLSALLLGCVGLAVIGATVNGYHDGPTLASVGLVLSTLLGFALAVGVQSVLEIESYTDAPAGPVFLTFLVIAVVVGAIAWLVGFGVRLLAGPPATAD